MTDKEMEFEEILSLAEAGDVDAMFILSRAYESGKGVDIDLVKSFEWTHKAAKSGLAHAMFNLSICYNKGEGTHIDLKKYFEWTKRAAEEGIVQAMFNLSLAYEYGVGVDIDLLESFKWIKKSAEKGNIESMYNLSLFYKNGDGVAVNLGKHFEWVRKAAKNGDARAMFNLGYAYYNKIGTNRNLRKSIEWFLKAGANGINLSYAFIAKHKEFKNYRYKKEFQFALDKYMEIYFPPYGDFKRISLDLSADFSDFINLLIDVENEHLYEPSSEKKLYHYTGQVVIQKILNKDRGGDKVNESFENRLRLYMASYLNDPTEGRYIFDFKFERNIKELDTIRNTFEPFSQDKECLVNNCKEQIYSLSFSESADNLNLWRAYGRGANGEANGVNIGIPYETLKQFNAISTVGISAKQFLHAEDRLDKQASPEGLFLLYKVKYGEKAVNEMWGKIAAPLNKLLKNIQKIYPKKDDDDTDYQLFYCVYLAMSRLMYLYKHDAYAAEQEVRALTMGGLDHPNLVADERTPARLYFNTPAILFQHKDSEIILGPQMSSEDKAVLVW